MIHRLFNICSTKKRGGRADLETWQLIEDVTGEDGVIRDIDGSSCEIILELHGLMEGQNHYRAEHFLSQHPAQE